jgi:hypothetical protein
MDDVAVLVSGVGLPDLAGARIGVRFQLVLHAEPRRDPRDQRPQVEGDRAVRGRDVPVLAEILTLE